MIPEGHRLQLIVGICFAVLDHRLLLLQESPRLQALDFSRCLVTRMTWDPNAIGSTLLGSIA
jgi:hypothetical protein